MTVSRRNFLKWSGASVVGVGAAAAGVSTGWAKTPTAFAQEQGSPELHVLNRLTWGVRPADLERIAELGIAGYIDWQLDYQNVADPLVDGFVASRRMLSMSLTELDDLLQINYENVLITALWARLYRAAFSERQLYERMVEFWTDHFNIPIPDLVAGKVVDDREVVRKHALGSFRDLLFASAQSPAMLYYLDQFNSTKEHPNENYARELMELHTLGVEGGYTEVDVVEVARAFTGWTIREEWREGFIYSQDAHDTDEKTVLGVTLPAGRGIEDGLQVLDLLVRHPATARFISKKLVRRFVSDAPPDALVESTALVFMTTDGDLKQVMRHILTSPEFMASQGQKFRRPLDFVVAMLRALQPGIDVEYPAAVVYTLEPMSQLPYFWFPPNGYPDVAGAWISTNGLLNRWNAAINLAAAGEGMFEGVALNLDMVIPEAATVGELVDTAAQHILGAPLPDADRTHFINFVSRDGDEGQRVDTDLRNTKLSGVVGLLMASPYFQWR
ncbi:MAG: DUF1800 domain-containing protein [Armatimonadetes bacterium]|nr:DUF1800 domain-containing protein [Anaerolineae bacterium]